MSLSTLSLRQARPQDSDFAYRVKRAAFREYIEQVWGWDENEQRRLHEQRCAAQVFRIINVAGTDVGIVATFVGDNCVTLNQMFVLPEHQGRGVGTACMLLILDEARDLGLAVRLRVMKANPWARTFYERLGFARTGETDTHDLMEWKP